MIIRVSRHSSSPEPDANLETILEWADEIARLRVYANADTPADARRAGRTAPRASGSAAPSTCSWPRIGCRSCAR